MPDYSYQPAACRSGRCNHSPNHCLHYRSRRCLSGECNHARQNLPCAVNYPTTNASDSEPPR